MVIISLSSITLAAEDPVVELSTRNRILDIFDHAFTGVFAAEMILKVPFQYLFILSMLLFTVVNLLFDSFLLLCLNRFLTWV